MKKIITVLLLVLLTACGADDVIKDYSEENEQEILTYIADNNIVAEKSDSGLYYVIDNPGTGDTPIDSDRVKVSYKGYFTDGTIFEENEEGISFFLQEAILGWREGVTYFKEGGSGKLIIPAHLAYGNNDTQTIPAGSVLIFDIELIYVNYETENEQQIEAYLLENNLDATKSDTGLYYTVEELGEGQQSVLTDNVTLSYKGYFIDNTVFDEGSDSISFDLENLIKGFSEGVTYFKEGGNGTLYIPAHLAYGNSGTTGILPGSVLIFDIGIISVN